MRLSKPPALANEIAAAPHSAIREITNRAVFIPGAIRLEVGQPSFPTPEHIREAAKSAIDQGWNFYTQTAGLMTLRERIVAKLQRVNGITCSPQEVVCAPGGAGALSAAITAVTAPGEGILVPDPGWPNYFLMAAANNLDLLRYRCPPDNDYLPDLDHLDHLVNRRVRVLLVNSPNNPTGAIYPRRLLEALCSFAQKHNLWLIADECYDQIVLDPGDSCAIARILDDGRVISVFSFSKTYSMTGWRLGYAVARPEVADSIVKTLEANSTCTSTVTQKAAEAALDGPQDHLDHWLATYRLHRDQSLEILSKGRLSASLPHGAFYVMADVSSSGMSSRDFALRLLEEERVAVAPGAGFGVVGDRAVRISFAGTQAELKEGLDRLVRFAVRGTADRS